MLFFWLIHLHSLPLKPVSFRFRTPIRVTCYTLSSIWKGHVAEQARAQDNLVTWQMRARNIVILVFLKGFCWGSTFQRYPIVRIINSDRSFCLYWAALNQQTGIFRSFSSAWFVMVTASAKVTHARQASCAQVLHVCSVVLCALSTVNTLKLSWFKQT